MKLKRRAHLSMRRLQKEISKMIVYECAIESQRVLKGVTHVCEVIDITQVFGSVIVSYSTVYSGLCECNDHNTL